MKGSQSIVSVTFSHSRASVRVSMGLLEFLSLPKYIRFLINSNTKTFAVEATNKSDASAIKITYPMNKLTNGYVTHSQLLLERIYELMNWDTTKRYRVYGEFVDEHEIGIFDLSKAHMINDLKMDRRKK